MKSRLRVRLLLAGVVSVVAGLCCLGLATWLSTRSAFDAAAASSSITTDPATGAIVSAPQPGLPSSWSLIVPAGFVALGIALIAVAVVAAAGVVASLVVDSTRLQGATDPDQHPTSMPSGPSWTAGPASGPEIAESG